MENNLQKYDLHIHTTYSPDSRITAEGLVETAVEKGLTGVAVTDHDEIRGAYKVKQLAEELAPELDVVIGAEITAENAHVLALGIEELVPKYLSVEETIERIHDQNGVAICAHPYPPPVLPHLTIRGDAVNYAFDAVETWNGLNLKRNNEKAVELAAQHNFVAAGGSDAHLAKTVGRTYTVIHGENVVDAIRNGGTYMDGAHAFPFTHAVETVLRGGPGEIWAAVKRHFT